MPPFVSILEDISKMHFDLRGIISRMRAAAGLSARKFRPRARRMQSATEEKYHEEKSIHIGVLRGSRAHVVACRRLRSQGVGGGRGNSDIRSRRSGVRTDIRLRLVVPARPPQRLPVSPKRQHDARAQKREVQGAVSRKRIRKALRPSGNRGKAVLRDRQNQRLRHLLPSGRHKARERRNDGRVDFRRRGVERISPPPRDLPQPRGL